jgi:hypothetical protein
MITRVISFAPGLPGHVVEVNPAHAVRGPKHGVKKGRREM